MMNRFLQRVRAAALGTDPSRPSIRRQGRDQYLYVEGDRKMIVFAELMPGDAVLVDFDSIYYWLPPHDKEVLDQKERFEVLEKFCACLSEQNISFTIRK